MNAGVHGIHHVTAIAGDPQQNHDFYTGVMGMRLVKRSVNQDDPGTYHLFYADAVGTPGTDLTFFPWPAMGPGRAGIGLVMEVQFAVPLGTLGWWSERLASAGAAMERAETRFGAAVLPLRDPHGLPLALVETGAERPFTPWAESPVPEDRQLRGMHSVRLWERRSSPTEEVLTGALGFTRLDEHGGWIRYGLPEGAPGTIVEIREMPERPRGSWGTGAVHHVAFRTRDVPHEMDLRSRLIQAGLDPTPLIDRFWFESVYFREPGGVLFELATDGPGFSRDESTAGLGERLILPPWLEPRRAAIEASLPPLKTVPSARSM